VGCCEHSNEPLCVMRGRLTSWSAELLSRSEEGFGSMELIYKEMLSSYIMMFLQFSRQILH
jgi:hypothetical protein